MGTAPKRTAQAIYLFPDAGIGHQLRDTCHSWDRISQLEMKRFDLTAPMWLVMRALMLEDGLTQKELVEHAALTQSSTSTLLSRLLARGLVVSSASDEDGRVVRYFITTKARSLFKELGPDLIRLRHRLIKGFSEEEIATLMDLLLRVKRNCIQPDATEPMRAPAVNRTASKRR